MKKFAIVLGLSVSLLMACSQTPPAPTGTTTPAPAAATATPEPAGFQLKAGDEAIPFEPSTARVDVRTDVQEAQFSVANYEFAMEHMAAGSIERPKEDGKVRIAFSIKGELREGDGFKDPVTPGEYSGDKLIWMDIYRGKGGNDEVFNLENGQGAVKIETVTDTELSGTIDVTGDNGFMVKGAFKAERVSAE